MAIGKICRLYNISYK